MSGKKKSKIPESLVSLKGSKTKGYVILIIEPTGWKGDFALKESELEQLYEILKNKYARNTLPKQKQKGKRAR